MLKILDLADFPPYNIYISSFMEICYMFKYEYLCVKLKELRLEMGYTQKQLASLLRISVYRLSKLENLKLKASITEVASLIHHLDAKFDYIIGESSVKKFPEDIKYSEIEKYEKEHNTIKHKK